MPRKFSLWLKEGHGGFKSATKTEDAEGDQFWNLRDESSGEEAVRDDRGSGRNCPREDRGDHVLCTIVGYLFAAEGISHLMSSIIRTGG